MQILTISEFFLSLSFRWKKAEHKVCRNVKTTMKFIIILRVLLLSSTFILTYVEGDEERVERNPMYNMAGGIHRFICSRHKSHHCTWLKNHSTFDPIRYGYHYDNKNTCSIKANKSSINQLRDISCVRYISYITIKAAVSESVVLNCQPAMNTNCSWKRNDAIVSISGRYTPASNLTKSKTCSVRIDNVNSIDYGNWTCNEQSTDKKNNEIIAVFTLVSKPNSVTENYNNVAVSSQSVEQDNTGSTTQALSKIPEINITESPASTEPSTDGSFTSTTSGDGNSLKDRKQLFLLVGLSVVGAVAIILLVIVIILCKRSKQRKRNSAVPNVNLKDVDSSKSVKSTFHIEPEEAIYANLQSPHVTASEVGDISMETDPEVNITYPDNNKSNDETEVVYTQVIVTKKASVAGAPEVPHYDINQVTYASVKRRRVSQDLSK